MMLLITTSFDATSDILAPLFKKISRDDFFRFNTDLYEHYDILIDKNGFQIKDPFGREINLENIDSVYWRKPWMSADTMPGTLEHFEELQRKYAVREIINVCRGNNVWFLVEPYAEHRVGKIVQMQIGRKYFNVPEWKIALGNSVQEIRPPWLVKALYSDRVENKAPLVKRWTTDTLSNSYQWFLQKEVTDSTYDITIVYVCGKMFGYRYPRAEGKIDWRIDCLKTRGTVWEYFELDIEIKKSIAGYMEELNLNYGRLDFIMDATGKFYFLEVNPNGQFAWLDLKNEHGLLTTIAKCSLSSPE